MIGNLYPFEQIDDKRMARTMTVAGFTCICIMAIVIDIDIKFQLFKKHIYTCMNKYHSSNITNIKTTNFKYVIFFRKLIENILKEFNNHYMNLTNLVSMNALMCYCYQIFKHIHTFIQFSLVHLEFANLLLLPRLVSVCN